MPSQRSELESRVAELEQQVEALKESERRLNGLLSSVSDMVFGFDTEGRFTFFRAPDPSDLYVAPEQFIGRKHGDVMPPELGRKLSEAIERSRQGEITNWDYQLEVRGQTQWYSARLAPVFDNGKLTGSVAMVKNITERRQADERLARLNRVLRAVRSVNQLIAKEKDRDRLLTGLCSALVEERGFLNAMVVALGSDGVPTEVAVAGHGDPAATVLERMRRSGLPPCAERSLASPRPIVIERSQCGECPLTAPAETVTVAARIAGVERVHGLVLSCLPPGVCPDDEELGLFGELADDVALALDSLGQEAERRRVEAALKESEKRFQDIAWNALETIWEVDAAGRYTYVSPVVERTLGYRPEELVGKPFYELITGNQREELTRAALAALARKAPFRQVVSPIRHRDGRVVWLSTSGIPVLDERGELAGFRGADTDITQLRQAEQALRESEESYRKLYEKVPVGLYRSAAAGSGTFLSANPAMAAMLGYSDPAGLERTAVEGLYVDPQDRKRLLAELREQGGVEGFVCELRRRDGTRFWASVSARATVAEDGTLYHIDGIVADISDLKRTSDGLRDSLRRLRHTIEGTIAAMAAMVEMKDPYTSGHQQRVAELACAIARQLGLEEGRIVGIGLAGRIHDVGKIGVPAEILSKPGPISDIEFDLIRTHPRAGFDILKGIEFEWPIAEMVLQHHEKLDGSGYPQGLRGEQILLDARILAVADHVEAMASHRPYRPARGVARALEELEAQKEVLFDPAVVDACQQLFRERKVNLDTWPGTS